HGQALAYAAQAFGIPCVVVIRDDAQVTKLQAIRRYGAEIVLTPIGQWQERLEEEQHKRDLHLVHPFDDPAVAAGQGTVGLEILEAVADVRTVIVPRAKLVVEPAGAAGVAALASDSSIRRPVVAVLTGGNVDGQRLSSWLA